MSVVHNSTMKRKILCLYSGGIKSISCLLSILDDPKYKDFLVQIHYIHILNYKQQSIKSLNEVKSTLPILRDFYGRDFIVTENQINFNCLPIKSPLPSDSDICLFVASQILNIDISVRYVAFGFSVTQLNQIDEYGCLADKMEANLQITRKNPYSALDAEYLLPLSDVQDSELGLRIKKHAVFSRLNNIFTE